MKDLRIQSIKMLRGDIIPTYVYQCDNCGYTFEIKQSFEDKPLKKCKSCFKHKLYKVPQVPHTFIYQSPKTLDHLASKNRDRMSEDEKYSIDPMAVEAAKKRQKKQYDIFGNKIDKDLFKMNPKQLKKYVETGEKPDFEGIKNEVNSRRKRARRNSKP